MVTWKKVGEKLGSNEGGTYMHASGTKHYVKFPKNPDQAKTEALSARIAEAMGIKTTSPDWEMIDGKIGVASVHKNLFKIDWSNPEHMISSMSGNQRLQLARMFFHAKLTKNWDVLGVDASNIMMDSELNLVQMDTGGSFEFRAQGKHKDYGVDTTDTNLFDPALPSGKVFNALKALDPAAFKIALGDLKNKFQLDKNLDYIFDNSELKNATVLKFTFAQRLTQLKSVAPQVIAPPKPVAPMYKPPHDTTAALSLKAQLIAAKSEKWPKKGEPGYLDSNQRLRAAAKFAYESDGGTASQLIAASIKMPPPPITNDGVNEVSSYVGSSNAINGLLRKSGGDLATLSKSDYEREVYTKKVKILDDLLSQTRDYSMPVKVVRGVPNVAIPHDIKPGDTFVDHGFQSTSFSGKVAKDFGSGNTLLRVTLPKGFKFLAVPAFARAATNAGKHVSHHAVAEAECILPRGVGYRVKKIEQDGGHRVMHVHAVFSSIQPPGTEWVSTRTAKAKAKLQQQEPPGGSTV